MYHAILYQHTLFICFFLQIACPTPTIYLSRKTLPILQMTDYEFPILYIVSDMLK